MAEGEGFEPPVRFPVQWFSRPPVSTAHASLRGLVFIVYLCEEGNQNEPREKDKFTLARSRRLETLRDAR
jgi:hypothetical protein